MFKVTVAGYLIAMFACGLLMTATFAHQDSGQDARSKEIFSTVKILGVKYYIKDVSGYSNGELQGVGAAKGVLTHFFNALQKNSNTAQSFLTDAVKNKYTNSAAIYDFLTRGAEGIIEFRIFDFSYSKDKKTLLLRYDLTTTSEGTLCTYQHSVSLQLVADQWRISALH